MSQELLHYYGPQYHISTNPVLQGLLAELCAPTTFQPRIDQLVTRLYEQLLFWVAERELAIQAFVEPTRMTAFHPEVQLQGHRVCRSQRAVIVDIARAGTLPSLVCYQRLHDFLKPESLRQDHIFASRVSGEDHHVAGTHLASTKIGGGKEEAVVLIPDPMGATGSTLKTVLDHYRDHVPGQAKKTIAMHLIVTPEYLKRVHDTHPELIVYALRLDRGLSSQAILNSPPGLHWDQEKGLNDHDYIVPGGGGFGEIMNNSFV